MRDFITVPTHRTAKKPHCCYLCGQTIKERTLYQEYTNCYDGRFTKIRVHEECFKLTHQWSEDDWEYHDPHEFRKALEKKNDN